MALASMRTAVAANSADGGRPHFKSGSADSATDIAGISGGKNQRI
jgi:hypothetical protein